MMEMLAALQAAVEIGNDDAGDRALEEAGPAPRRRPREQFVPGRGEACRARAAAELIGPFPGHADGAGGAARRASLDERLDEAGLPRGRPPVAARTDGTGVKAGKAGGDSAISSV